MTGTVLVDFDGTLAARPGLWAGCVLEVLDEFEEGHELTLDQVRLGLRDGFPWHRAHEPHLQLSSPEQWWTPVQLLIARCLMREGLGEEAAIRVASATRERFADPSRGWRLFDDSLAALQRLRDAGWRIAILSNHIPELSVLVDGLGLAGYVDVVLSSALIGYEKPHPEAFRAALKATGQPRVVWMVGDNPTADVQGAEAVGVPAILVRRQGDARYCAADLLAAADLILR